QYLRPPKPNRRRTDQNILLATRYDRPMTPSTVMLLGTSSFDQVECHSESRAAVEDPPGHHERQHPSAERQQTANDLDGRPTSTFHTERMSTADQTLGSALHREALLTARRPELRPLIDHLAEQAQGRDDIRTECAGIIAGAWFASPGRGGEEFIAAGLLILGGHVDSDELDDWIQVGWERQRGARALYPGSEV